MSTLFALSSFQMAFVAGFLVLAFLLTVLLKSKRLLLVAALLVVSVLILHYVSPVMQLLAHHQGVMMGYSIFSSKPTWSSSRSREPVRTDVETVEQAHSQVDQLVRQGHNITDVRRTEADRRGTQRRR